MDLIFYYNSSENNKVDKSLSAAYPLVGTLRDDCDIINPQILVKADSLSAYNYAYIPEFNRYYFIKEINIYRNELWIVSLSVDVLMSYKNDILELSVILQESEIAGINNYLSDDRVWFNSVKDKTDIINFPNGLLENGEYILITAGGGSAT